MPIVLSPGPMRIVPDRETWEQRHAESLCPLCRQPLTEENTSTDADVRCFDCDVQRWEEEALHDAVERLASELCEALDEYQRARRPSRESSRMRATVAVLRGVVRVMRQIKEGK